MISTTIILYPSIKFKKCHSAWANQPKTKHISIWCGVSPLELAHRRWLEFYRCFSIINWIGVWRWYDCNEENNIIWSIELIWYNIPLFWLTGSRCECFVQSVETHKSRNPSQLAYLAFFDNKIQISLVFVYTTAKPWINWQKLWDIEYLLFVHCIDLFIILLFMYRINLFSRLHFSKKFGEKYFLLGKRRFNQMGDGFQNGSQSMFLFWGNFFYSRAYAIASGKVYKSVCSGHHRCLSRCPRPMTLMIMMNDEWTCTRYRSFCSSQRWK